MRAPLALLAAAALALAGCASAPRSASPAFDSASAVAAVRAAGQADASELDVQPLRDPQVEDLRQRAARQEASGDIAGAVASLDQALALNADDPALLQERAEIALLAGALADAERFARQAIERGSATGPLCRRHWETLVQVGQARRASLAAAEQAAADARIADARRRREACTVAPPPRF